MIFVAFVTLALDDKEARSRSFGTLFALDRQSIPPPQYLQRFESMCSAELAEWLSLIVFESDRCLSDVLYELQSMAPEEREELTELHPFDLEHIEAELIRIIENQGDSVTADDLKTLEPIAA